MAAIYLKNTEMFSPTVLYESDPVGFVGGLQIGAHSICNAPAVAELDKQTLQSSQACRFLRDGNVWSLRDLRATELLAWEVDRRPVEWEDMETALVALASMMLTSCVELLRSRFGRWTCGSCWGQPAASWMVGRRTPFPSPSKVLTSHRHTWPCGPGMVMRRQAKVANRSILGVPHVENTGHRGWLLIDHSAMSVWPTHDRASAWTLWDPGRCTGMNVIPFSSQNLTSRIIRRVSLNDLVPPSFMMYDTTTALSHIRRTTRDLSWGRKPVTAISTASMISNRLMCWVACWCSPAVAGGICE